MLFISALAAMVLAGSCQQELNPVTDGDTTVTFSVAAGDVATKAIADGTNVDALYWEIYGTDVKTAAAPLGNGSTKERVDGKFTVTLKLLADQEYNIIFWAQVDGNNHYEWTDLRNISIKDASDIDANDESRAAFFKVYNFTTENGVSINETVTLKRPFSQINLGSTTYETSFNNVNGGNVKVETSQMTVTQVATSFNTLDGVGEGEQVITYNAAATPNGEADKTQKILEVNGLYYYWLGMNYLIVNGDSDNVDVDITLVTNFGNVEHTVKNVPVKENYRTNLLGDFLTTGATFTVVVDETFQTPDNLYGEDWTYAGNYQYSVLEGAAENTLSDILAHADGIAREAATKAAAPVVTINLDGDVYWTTGAGHGSTPLLPADSPISAVVINGNDNTFTATGAGVGSVRLANGGKLTFNDVNVVDESVSYAENSWEFTYLEFAGNLEFNGCTFNSGIQFQTEGEEAVVNASCVDCKFISYEASVYAVWICDGYTSFENCSFEGTRGLKAHEDYGSEVAEVIIDGCTFGPIEKKPGIALGTLNAETKVSITNSAFIGCQAGEQGLYIYETDTDVKSFDFTCEGNDVTNTKAELLTQRLENAQAGDEVKVPAGEYTFPSSKIGAGVTLVCDEGTVFTGNSKLNINGATVIGATFSNPSGTTADGTINGTFKDCVFEGSNALRWCYAGETVVFENCVFSGNTYGVHFDGGANEVIFRNCTFSGFNATAAAITMITFEGCTFKANGKSNYNGINLWGSAKMINTNFEFDGSVGNEWVDAISADKTYEFTGCTINGGTIMSSYYFFSRNTDTDITIDGTLYEDYSTVTYLASAKDMTWFAEQVNVEKNSYNGKTVKVTADIDLKGVNWVPVGQTGATQFMGTFDGQGKTISNLTIDATAQTGANYSTGLFGWLNKAVVKNVNVNGASVKGNHNVAVIAGYLETSGCTVENCHVTGAAVECHVANSEANGDKCGVIVGNVPNAGTSINSCTAKNSTVSAGRDAGQVVGAAKEAYVVDCSAENVTVTANGEGTGKNIRNEVIGRVL